MADLTLKQKLMKVQTELKAPKNLYNSFGKYNYRNAEGILEALKPLEAKYNFFTILHDEIISVGDRIYVKSTASIHDCESDEMFGSVAVAREASEKKGMDDAQVTGATSSYARKYALNGLFLLDDTKDVDTEEYQSAPAKKQTKRETKTETTPAVLICENCKKPIPSHGKNPPSVIAQASLSKFGKQLCWDCGHALKEQGQKKEEAPLAIDDMTGLPFPIEE